MESSNKNKVFALRLNEELKKLDITQTDFCKKTKISSAAFFNYKAGKRLPDIDNLIKLAEEFNCTTDYLLGLTDIKSSDVEYQTIHEITGLSDKTIEYLNKFSTNGEKEVNSNNDIIKTLNYLVENEEKYHLLKSISTFIWTGNVNYNQLINKDQAIAKVQIDKILFNIDNDIRNADIFDTESGQK